MAPLEKIGRYEIRKKLAHGGMGVVYLGYDPFLKREVAIKVLIQGTPDEDDFRKRFDREARIIANMENPNIVEIFDFGEEDGQPYIVMKYMRGGTLEDRLKDGKRLSLLETARIITRLAPALDDAHNFKVIHRDIKPANILFDTHGNAYLTDFGIARSTSGEMTLTSGATIVGTPNYMSPEQVQGDGQIDGRSDLYSLGVVAYHMLTGQPPYKGNTPWSIMLAHVNQPVPHAFDVCCDLPKEVDDVLARALSKDPEDRYQTVEAFARDLQALADLMENQTQSIPRPPADVTLHSTPTMSIDREKVQRVTPPPVEVSASGTATTTPTAPHRTWTVTSIGLWAIAVALLIAVSGLAAQGLKGSGPLAFLAAPSATLPPTPAPPTPPPATRTVNVVAAAPTFTAQPPSATPAPTNTIIPTPTLSPTDPPTVEPATPTHETTSAGLVIGGADRIAYLNKGEIWVANMDGSNDTQVTDDGVDKTDIGWTPDGQSLYYISGKCIYITPLAGGTKQSINCFTFAEKLQAFEISPDGKQVAINLDNQLHILPYDINTLRSIATRDDLEKNAGCKDFAPYARYRSEFAHWSQDSSQLALMIWGAADRIGSADTVHTISLKTCTDDPDVAINFPPPFFLPSEYKVAPNIPSFAWDGLKLYVMNTLIRNQGFGKLYAFNADQYKARGPLNVISECCYRDPVFTPDGKYLLFAYQRYPIGDTTDIFLYLVNIGSLDTKEKYQPLPIPPIDGKTQPMPVLRPAR